MAVPFYVSPEQVMKDRAEYARKGIARGRTLVALEFEHGIVFVGENPSRSLYKTSEIYDRIAYAAVGKYNEFESLRVAGIRLADVKGYQYGRTDVTAKSLANAYSQALGGIFMGDSKPFEVELLIAEVPDADGRSRELYHILYDGSIVDEQHYVAIGGQAEDLTTALGERFEEGLSFERAVAAGVGVLTGAAEREVPASDLEVSGLDTRRQRRQFFRLTEGEVAATIGATAS